MRDSDLQLFRLKARVHIVERLALKANVILLMLAGDLPMAKALKETEEMLEKTAAEGESALLGRHGDIQGALVADEFREIVEELKEYLRALPGEMKKGRGG